MAGVDRVAVLVEDRAFEPDAVLAAGGARDVLATPSQLEHLVAECPPVHLDGAVEPDSDVFEHPRDDGLDRHEGRAGLVRVAAQEGLELRSVEVRP